MPRKITVTRVAAMRSRELTRQGIATFHRAATADGAGKSGLTALIYAYMANFACDAALAVALANTLFFSAATGESKSKVALYLLITLAPFAVIAPLIGPALDRLQRGRRLALAASFVVRIGLAVVLALNFNSWVLYPAALGMLVMSKSFGVLKSAMTPRVLPPEMDLVRVNSRLQIFGLLGGTTVAGAIAGAIALLTGSAGALWFTALLAAGGAYLSMRIPSWVEVTEGEVPATLSYHGHQTATGQEDLAHRPKSATSGRLRQPLGRTIIVSLWGTATIKMLIGFLFLYVPFVAKAHTDKEGLVQLAMAGAIGAAAGIGNIAGNALGARLKLGRPGMVVLRCTIAATAVAALAAGTHTMITVAVAALIANIASALAKVSLDASIQNDLPDESRASAFGRSETVLQLSWVFGGALGVLLPTEYWIGFTVISVLLTIGLVQTILSYRGYSVLPGLGSSHRPRQAAPEGNVTSGASAENVR
ncbi:MFS transporter [Rhodococcus sp. D2-41]|nr:MFS transporter [Rhodococcus sp. D2-41]